MILKFSPIIKYISFGMLLIALFLPLSRCAMHDGPDSMYKCYYAWTHFRAGGIGSWLLILLFLWPLMFLLAELIVIASARRSSKV
jgi:hypothetical protein